MILIYSAFYT